MPSNDSASAAADGNAAAFKAGIEEKLAAGERLTYDDGVGLYEIDDLAWLGRLAHGVREAKNGDRTMFNVNRHLNLTNVCSASCAYCSFQRKPGESDAYTMRIEQAVALAEQMKDDAPTELHIVNGLHPTLPWRYYPRVLSALKETLPQVNLKAFTATEIQWFEKISGMDASEILDELIEAGLESLTGGGAEIFDWEVRQHIVDHDCHWEDWSRIHSLAHAKGLRTPATMLYGHIEEPRHRVDHVLRLRELQDETGGFSVFIPCATSTTSTTPRTGRSATGSRRAPPWPARPSPCAPSPSPGSCWTTSTTSSASGSCTAWTWRSCRCRSAPTTSTARSWSTRSPTTPTTTARPTR
ncbi:hypothetical protein GCM10029992_05020 [Glycomyces albus]